MKRKYSNIMIALIFFIVGIGIGGIVGIYNGYNLGYKYREQDDSIIKDSISNINIVRVVGYPDKLKTKYGYE